MVIRRRDMLQMMVAASVVPLLPSRINAAADELYAAAVREPDGGYAVAFFSPESGVVQTTALPDRGHSCLTRPGWSECIAFARRPGTFAIAVHLDGRAAPLPFASSPERHFYGHGAFSHDGRLLYSTENDYVTSNGVIGVRDANAGYRRIGEFSSGGVGPHDIVMLPDGRTLVVANGGIETHPDIGREPLNLSTMRPNLAYIDAETGDLLERHELPADMHRLSIRHLAVARSGSIVFGCQHKGARNLRPGLVGFHKRGENLKLAEVPSAANDRLKGYVASVASDASGEIVAATSPRGGVALYFDVPGRRFLGFDRFADVSGVVARKSQPGFVLTSGTGHVGRTSEEGIARLGRQEIAWDNHVTVVR